jgi:NADPH2:quinone reductase
VVQLAKSVGARVIATVGSAQKKSLCESWGADLVLDYHAENLDQQIRNFAERFGGINVWFETQREPTLDRSVGLMAKRGRIVLMAGRDARPEFPVGPFYVNDLRLLGFAMFNASPEEQRAAATTINILTENGGWKPNIGKVFPLKDAALSHQLQEDNTLNKTGTLDGYIVLEV